jgi:hypothetical protein
MTTAKLEPIGVFLAKAIRIAFFNIISDVDEKEAGVCSRSIRALVLLNECEI